MNSTSVAPGVSKTANDLVIAFLAAHQGSTTDEIMTGIGRSRKGVLRVCNANVLITEVDRKGKGKAWRVNMEALVEGTRFDALPVEAELSNEMARAAVNNLATLDGMGINDGLQALAKSLDTSKERIESLRKAAHIALAIQNGNVKDLDEAFLYWAKVLGDIEKIKLAGLLLSSIADRYLNNPVSKSADWWSLFPKENNHG